MAIREFKIRYGETVYEHRGGKAYPKSFYEDLFRNMGVKVAWGNGTSSTTSPTDPDAAYHFVVDGLHHGLTPDETITLIDDTPLGGSKG